MRRPSARRKRVTVRVLYQRLSRAFGTQHWWPAQTPFEVMVGAMLTQATNWHNVERAIERLRQARALTPRRLVRLPRHRLERCVQPSGYFRQKAQRVQQFARWYLERYGGLARRMFGTPWPQLRRELLAQHGIGPETADSILLYAGGQPVFVIDAYTRRVFQRHRLIRPSATYDVIQRLVMRRMGQNTRCYNEFHALLVEVGKRYCHRRDPACGRCPLGDLPRTLEKATHGNR